MEDYAGVGHFEVAINNMNGRSREHARRVVSGIRREIVGLGRALDNIERCLSNPSHKKGYDVEFYGVDHELAVAMKNFRNWSISIAHSDAWLQTSLSAKEGKSDSEISISAAGRVFYEKSAANWLELAYSQSVKHGISMGIKDKINL